MQEFLNVCSCQSGRTNYSYSTSINLLSKSYVNLIDPPLLSRSYFYNFFCVITDFGKVDLFHFKIEELGVVICKIEYDLDYNKKLNYKRYHFIGNNKEKNDIQECNIIAKKNA